MQVLTFRRKSIEGTAATHRSAALQGLNLCSSFLQEFRIKNLNARLLVLLYFHYFTVLSCTKNTYFPNNSGIVPNKLIATDFIYQQFVIVRTFNFSFN